MKLLFQNKALFSTDVKGPMHSHHFWQLDYYEGVSLCHVNIEGGSGRMLNADGKTLILIAPYTPHLISTLGNCVCYALKFETEENAFPGVDSCLIKYDDYSWIFERLFNAINPRNELEKNISEHLLSILMLELRKSKGFHSSGGYRMEPRIRNAIEYMSKNMLLELSPASIASVVNISVTHFTRLFRKQTGMSPMHYLRKLKMGRASKMLKFSDFNISQVAEMLHYPDIHTFSRAFKMEKGVSPRAYRESEKTCSNEDGKRID